MFRMATLLGLRVWQEEGCMCVKERGWRRGLDQGGDLHEQRLGCPLQLAQAPAPPNAATYTHTRTCRRRLTSRPAGRSCLLPAGAFCYASGTPPLFGPHLCRPAPALRCDWLRRDHTCVSAQYEYLCTSGSAA